VRLRIQHLHPRRRPHLRPHDDELGHDVDDVRHECHDADADAIALRQLQAHAQDALSPDPRTRAPFAHVPHPAGNNPPPAGGTRQSMLRISARAMVK